MESKDPGEPPEGQSPVAPSYGAAGGTSEASGVSLRASADSLRTRHFRRASSTASGGGDSIVSGPDMMRSNAFDTTDTVTVSAASAATIAATETSNTLIGIGGGADLELEPNRSDIEYFALLETLDVPQYVKENGECLTFPEKLMLMLVHSEKQVAELGMKPSKVPLGWVQQGRVFYISDKDELSSKWLPIFFQRVKFPSFTRKLYRWGFRQVSVGGAEADAIEGKPAKSPSQGIGPPLAAGDDSNKKMALPTKKKKVLYFHNENFRRNHKSLMSNMKSVTAASKRAEEARGISLEVAGSVQTESWKPPPILPKDMAGLGQQQQTGYVQETQKAAKQQSGDESTLAGSQRNLFWRTALGLQQVQQSQASALPFGLANMSSQHLFAAVQGREQRHGIGRSHDHPQIPGKIDSTRGSADRQRYQATQVQSLPNAQQFGTRAGPSEAVKPSPPTPQPALPQARTAIGMAGTAAAAFDSSAGLSSGSRIDNPVHEGGLNELQQAQILSMLLDSIMQQQPQSQNTELVPQIGGIANHGTSMPVQLANIAEQPNAAQGGPLKQPPHQGAHQEMESAARRIGVESSVPQTDSQVKTLFSQLDFLLAVQRAADSSGLLQQHPLSHLVYLKEATKSQRDASQEADLGNGSQMNLGLPSLQQAARADSATASFTGMSSQRTQEMIQLTAGSANDHQQQTSLSSEYILSLLQSLQGQQQTNVRVAQKSNPSLLVAQPQQEDPTSCIQASLQQVLLLHKAAQTASQQEMLSEPQASETIFDALLRSIQENTKMVEGVTPTSASRANDSKDPPWSSRDQSK